MYNDRAALLVEDDDDDEGSWIEISSSNSSSSSDAGLSDESSIDESSIDDEAVRSPFFCDAPQTCHDRDFFKPEQSRPGTHHSSWRRGGILSLCFILFPLLLASAVVLRPSMIDFGVDGEESIYVPGVGFSGFWFSLGRLKSIQDPSSKHYVCFSAGCLGSVAILNGFSVDEMACMAESAQQAWKAGEIGRYDVVPQFVDGLVYRNFPTTAVGHSGAAGADAAPSSCQHLAHNNNNSTSTSNALRDNPHLLSKLHILTTTKSMRTSMRSPKNLNELRDMLIQTTWIPLATGNGFLHDGHMDGGFSLLEHPKCTKSVTLPLLGDAGLMLNSLNVNMGIDEAYRLWNEGLAYGL